MSHLQSKGHLVTVGEDLCCPLGIVSGTNKHLSHDRIQKSDPNSIHSGEGQVC
jgi:hypothetical protein